MAIDVRIPAVHQQADISIGGAQQTAVTIKRGQLASSDQEVVRADLFLQTHVTASVVVALERPDLMSKQQADFIVQFPSMQMRLRRIGDLSDTTLQDATDWTLYDLYYTF